jgi:uncharacterized protein (TIGR01244 family)
MDDRELRAIYNYRRASERIATAGQPTEDQLAAVAKAGCTVVINLGLHDADYALPDERARVESLGMAYIHIPVLWERPTTADLAQFQEALVRCADQDIFVHCAANVRVSVFVALDRVMRQGWPADAAFAQVDVPALPPVWQQFITNALSDRDGH